MNRPHSNINTEILCDKSRQVILILDDDIESIAIYRAVVSAVNGVSCSTDDGARALEQVSKLDRLDVILLDLDMPAMNGIRFYNQFRSLGCHQGARIILTSSHPFAADLAEALGLFAHIPKGMNIEFLKETILGALSNAPKA